jgi:hypothetical protein
MSRLWGQASAPEGGKSLLRRDTGEAIDDPGVARHLARDDLRVGVLSLDEQLHALNRGSGRLGDSTGHTAGAEINEELHGFQRKYFDRSDFGPKIIQHTGDALDIIPKLELTFDLVFIDAQKVNYDAYFEAAIQKTKPGSVILSDNVLWSGKVVEPVPKSDKATLALKAYNKKLQNDPRVDTVLLPIRDGLTLSRVK